MDSQILKMAIIGIDATIPEFSHEFYVNLRAALANEIDHIIDDPIPLLDGFELCEHQGYIKVNCGNEYSKQWLASTVEKLSLFEEQPLLTLIKEESVPKSRPFYVHVPYTTENDVCNILETIKRSMPNLKTELWQIRKLEGFANGTATNIEIDSLSSRLIEEMKYLIDLGVGKAYFWDIENKKGHPEAKYMLEI